MLITVYG